MKQSNDTNKIILSLKKDFYAFEHIDFKLKSDREFIINCLTNNVDGRILQFVNSYIFFRSYPLDIENISRRFNDPSDSVLSAYCSFVNDTIPSSQKNHEEILDKDFLEKIFDLTEHALWALSQNNSMEALLGYGTFQETMRFKHLFIFEELAFKNPRFYFKYFNIYKLYDKEWLEYSYGSTLLSTKKYILDNFESFTLSIFDDYLLPKFNYVETELDEWKLDTEIIIKKNFKEYLASILSNNLDKFYSKYDIESHVERITQLSVFQELILNIKNNK